MKSLLVGAAATAALVAGSGVEASAAPGIFKITLYAGNSVLYTTTNTTCPASGQRQVFPNSDSNANAATHYKVHYAACNLTMFQYSNGTGRGVGLQRDGRKLGLGAVAHDAGSLVAYG